jgi:hypothetical protein
MGKIEILRKGGYLLGVYAIRFRSTNEMRGKVRESFQGEVSF